MTTFSFCATYVYGVLSIATIIAAVSRYEFFWVGPLIMVALLPALWIDFFIFMLPCYLYSGSLKEAAEQHDLEKIATIKKRRRQEFPGLFIIATQHTGMIALLGATALPIWWQLKTTFSNIFQNISQ